MPARRKAARAFAVHGRCMEEEAREIIKQAVAH
jgi:plasmid stability protein